MDRLSCARAVGFLDSRSLALLKLVDFGILPIERREPAPDARRVAVRFRDSESLLLRCRPSLLDVLIVRVELDGLGHAVVKRKCSEDLLVGREEGADEVAFDVVVDELNVPHHDLAVGLGLCEAVDDTRVLGDGFCLAVDSLERVDEAAEGVCQLRGVRRVGTNLLLSRLRS